ncbi:MAG: hypothetical protein HYV02_03565 [Deltaproteobacteria bacterium]|nr:hypothetical protein [Deltaproteobacteria bacterium]
MNRRIRHLGLTMVFGCLFLSSSIIHARETNIGDQYPSVARSVRALGMGNAFLTMRGRRTTDMFYNPATLHDLKPSWRFSAFGNDVGFSQKLIPMVKDLFDLSDDLKNSATDDGDINVFKTFFNKHVGEFQSVDYALTLFSMGRKDWGVALLTDSRTTVSMRNRAFPNFELHTNSDGIVAIGRSIGLFYDDLVLGALVKGIYRFQLDKIVTIGDILGGELGSIIGFDQWKRAFGIGGDIGARYAIPILWSVNPVIAVTYQDVAHTRFFAGDSGIDKTRNSLNAAIGIHPRLGDYELSVEAGASQLTDKRDIWTRLHAGAELRFPTFAATTLSVRGGTNQGYPTGGFSLEWPVATLDFAFYGEEKGVVKRVGANYKYAAAFNFYF